MVILQYIVQYNTSNSILYSTNYGNPAIGGNPAVYCTVQHYGNPAVYCIVQHYGNPAVYCTVQQHPAVYCIVQTMVILQYIV